jgi:hypothetical protein
MPSTSQVPSAKKGCLPTVSDERACCERAGCEERERERHQTVVHLLEGLRLVAFEDSGRRWVERLDASREALRAPEHHYYGEAQTA